MSLKVGETQPRTRGEMPVEDVPLQPRQHVLADQHAAGICGTLRLDTDRHGYSLDRGRQGRDIRPSKHVRKFCLKPGPGTTGRQDTSGGAGELAGQASPITTRITVASPPCRDDRRACLRATSPASRTRSRLAARSRVTTAANSSGVEPSRRNGSAPACVPRNPGSSRRSAPPGTCMRRPDLASRPVRTGPTKARHGDSHSRVRRTRACPATPRYAGGRAPQADGCAVPGSAAGPGPARHSSTECGRRPGRGTRRQCPGRGCARSAARRAPCCACARS